MTDLVAEQACSLALSLSSLEHVFKHLPSAKACSLAVALFLDLVSLSAVFLHHAMLARYLTLLGEEHLLDFTTVLGKSFATGN